ncbi:MAG: sulfur globule family protein [Gammaproteobacteria bacterium]
MKKIATVISALSMAVASASVSAWGWGDNGWGNNGYGDGFGDGDFDGDFGFSMGFSGHGRGRGYGRGYNGYNGYNGYGYGPYGYAPYAAPVAPAVLTEEQQQAIADQQAAIADQQASYVAQMQEAQKQAAEFYANQSTQVYSVQPAVYGNDFTRKMDEEHAARVKEMDARMEESRKAAEARRAEFYANQPVRDYGVQPAMYGDDFMKKMDEEHAARVKEMDVRMEESRKAAEARHAEFFANQPARGYGVQPAMYGDDFMKKMDEEHAARVKEMDARMEESRKAADLRRKEAQERFESRMKERGVRIADKTGA